MNAIQQSTFPRPILLSVTAAEPKRRVMVDQAATGAVESADV